MIKLPAAFAQAAQAIASAASSVLGGPVARHFDHKHPELRDVSVLFTTPKLLEELSERLSIPGAGIKGVFCGGTTMEPQTTRFLVEEVLEGRFSREQTIAATRECLEQLPHDPRFFTTSVAVEDLVHSFPLSMPH